MNRFSRAYLVASLIAVTINQTESQQIKLNLFVFVSLFVCLIFVKGEIKTGEPGD